MSRSENFFTMFLLVHSRSVHVFDKFFDSSGAIFKFVAVLRYMCNITPGGSDVREVGTNTTSNKLRTHNVKLITFYNIPFS